jgi:hypothetical protein
MLKPFVVVGSVAVGVLSQMLPSGAICRVTVPNGVEAGSSTRDEQSYGNGLLSVAGLWPEGTIVFKPGGPGFLTRDGALGMKFGWTRAVPGRLVVTGHRLDGGAGPLRLNAPNGYGDIGFQASYLIFATPGCWEVTAQVGDRVDSQLTFITKVVKIGEGPAWRFDPPVPGRSFWRELEH